MTASAEPHRKASRFYRAGVIITALMSLLIVWSSIVRDDGNAIGYFMVIMATGVGWFAAGFRPAGMARTMIGVAAMLILLGIAIATAPVTAGQPGGPLMAILYSAFFAFQWLVAALCFHAAARLDSEMTDGG